jgi:hypothetical protein
MKRLIPILFLFCAAFLISPIPAQAAGTDKPASAGIPDEPARRGGSVTITVVMPDAAPDREQEKEQEGTPFPSMPTVPGLDATPAAEATVIPKLYPTGVRDVSENGARWIVKTYELDAGEDPANIPCDAFERDGRVYSVTDVTKKETADADVREHVEIVTISTDTKEPEAILHKLAPTMEFTSEDGYTGVLALDVSGIAVETAGTKTSGYTVGATREYPHLSSNDTSLVPKSITDNGRTLNLASVEWKTDYAATVDYEQIPASYTAVATYSAQASRTVVTGYVTTAEYKGTLSKLNQGKTVYTAYFLGAQIKPERIPLEVMEPSPETTNKATPEPTPDAPAEPETQPETQAGIEQEQAVDIDTKEKGDPPSPLLPVALFALLLGLGGGCYVPRILKNKKNKGDATA